MADNKIDDNIWEEMREKPGVYVNTKNASKNFNAKLNDFENVKKSILSEVGSKLTDEQKQILEGL